MNTLKKACVLISIIAGMGSTMPVLAAASTGIQALGTAATALDFWTFSCPSKTISAAAKVEDLKPPNNIVARLRVMLIKSGGAALAEDMTPPSGAGEGGGASPNAVLAKKGGLYRMLFYKSAIGRADTSVAPTGVERYRGTVVCNKLSGPPVDPTTLTRTQNQ